jgi:hypothetical protein
VFVSPGRVVLFFSSLCLERVDFPSARAYDDYLEWCADQVYQLTYGGKVAADAAKVNMNNFSKEHQQLIDKSRKRKRAEQLEAERRDLRAAAGYDESAAKIQLQQQFTSNMSSLPSFTLPQPLEGESANGGLSAAALEDARISSIVDVNAKRREQWIIDETRRIAGGFKRDDDWRRSRQEATDGLFFF